MIFNILTIRTSFSQFCDNQNNSYFCQVIADNGQKRQTTHGAMGTLQNNIKAIRKKLGYTQQTVADVLGIARTTYTEYETKDIDIPFNTLEKLSDFFGVELASFFAENETQLKDYLVCAFRMETASVDDLRKIAHFKNIVKNYIKMKRIEG